MDVPIVEILRVGLPGLLFLLALLSFWLLKPSNNHKTGDQFRPQTTLFMVFALFLAIIASVVPLVEIWLITPTDSKSQILVLCRENLERLQTYARLEDTTLDGMRTIAKNTVSSCEPLMEEYNVR